VCKSSKGCSIRINLGISNDYAFAALKADGSIKAWGSSDFGGTNAPNAPKPTDKGYIKIYSTHEAFAALKANGSITTWGSLDNSWNEIKNKTTLRAAKALVVE
jgi:hypothetical protein